MAAITSATGCATLPEPEYPRLGGLKASQPQAELAGPSSNTAIRHNQNRLLTDSALSDEPDESPIEPDANENLGDQLTDVLYKQYKEWRGTRYRMGGLSKGGIDCSGFVYLTYLDRLGVELPRSTHGQVYKGRDVARGELQTGDLVFFRNGRVNHVGIYLENGKFMHSSTKSGVRISSLGNTYWQRTYWKARRLNLPSQNHLAQNP